MRRIGQGQLEKQDAAERRLAGESARKAAVWQISPGCLAVALLVAIPVVIFGFGFMLWFAAGYTEGDAGLDGMDLSPSYGPSPTPSEALAPPTPEEAAAACRAAQNGQVPESVGGAPLAGCDLSDVDLSQADLSFADLSGANLSDANLMDADLSDSDLSSANLSNAILVNADLSYSDLSDASLVLSKLMGADFFGANLEGADVQVTGLFGLVWSNTTCPDGSNSGAHDGTCVGYGVRVVV